MKVKLNPTAVTDKNIAEFLNERRFTVLFSGGKDSLATLLWVLNNVQHNDWNILYIEVTGNTHPLCIEYVKNTCRSLGVYNKLVIAKRNDLDFFECLRRWGVPIIGKYRWCMYQFKLKLMKAYSHLTVVTGVRRSDSHIRRKILPIGFFKITKNVSVNPIYNWNKKQVLAYIRKHGLELNPCYKIYGHSGSCMFCPYHNKRQIILTLQDPEWREKILSSLAAGKGPISREKYLKWMKYSKLKTITRYLEK